MPKPLMNATFMQTTHPFQTTTAPMAQRDTLREYLVRYVAADTVDSEGEDCPVCQLNGAQIECNVYAYDFDGTPLQGDTCSECVFPLIDEIWDTDPARIVLVERIPTDLATQRGYRS